MPRRPSAALLAVCTGAALAVPALAGTTAASAAPPVAAGKACPAPPQLTFSEPTYVDENRAGGEPLVFTQPDGRLMYSSHAGTTHFYTPEAPGAGTGAFIENYQGQTYIWTSDDDGKTWQFRPRVLPPEGAAASGFSDPEFAFDSAGNTYFSEINLANIAVSSSKDKGDSWTLENFFGAVLTDRQWMEADRPGELYFVANAFGGGSGVPPRTNLGHYISKSTDGGKTFTSGVADPGGLGDIRVDKRTGTVYEANYVSGKLGVKAFRKAREGDLTTSEVGPVAEGVNLVSSFAAIDLDPAGNVYITWDEIRDGEREAGIWFAVSKDGARTFSEPVRVDDGKGTAIWPWIAVGDEGRAAISWLQADVLLPENDAETPGDHGWRIAAAATTTALGCGAATTPSFSQAFATKEPVHRGTICQSGTTCQGTLTDRRLGDYISMDIDGKGFAYVGYSDTRVAGAVSLPGFVRQSGGPSMLAPKAGGKAPTATTGQPARPVSPGTTPQASAGRLPTTGAAALLPWSGALVLLGLGLAARRRRSA